MISLKAVKRKYIVQIILSYIPLLVTLVVSYLNVLPKDLIDYKLLLLLILLITPLLYSYILLLKNHCEELEEESNFYIQKAEEIKSPDKSPNSHLDDYQFHSQIGYYKHKKTGELFCSHCLLKNIPAQLREFDEHWRCTNCGRFYYKPGYEPFKSKNKGGSWLSS